LTILSWFILTDHSNFFLTFFFFAAYGMSVYGWVEIFVALFKNVKTGAAAGVLLHFATYYVRYTVPTKTTLAGKLFLSLFPNLCLTQGSTVLWKLEENESGLRFDSLNTWIMNYNLWFYFSFCILNTLLSTSIGLYLSNVLPQEFGISRSMCFCFQRSYWCRKKREYNSFNDEMEDFEIDGARNKNFESVSHSLKSLEDRNECLVISKLSKVYDNGK
jgi:ATP-binding cassette subfamily A (ABC1) protein 3